MIRSSFQLQSFADQKFFQLPITSQKTEAAYSLVKTYTSLRFSRITYSRELVSHQWLLEFVMQYWLSMYYNLWNIRKARSHYFSDCSPGQGTFDEGRWQLAFKCPSSYSTLKASIASQILTTTGCPRSEDWAIDTLNLIIKKRSDQDKNRMYTWKTLQDLINPD